MQNEYLLLKIDFQSGNSVLNDFWKQKMYFLTLDKILSKQKDEALVM